MIFSKRSKSLPRFHFFFNRDYKNIILYKYLQCKDIETNCRNKLNQVRREWSKSRCKFQVKTNMKRY